MTERIDTLKAKLSEARDLLNRVLDAVGDRWETPVYSDGLQWNVRQLVVHLADADRGNSRQAQGIAAGMEVIPADFDIERYNRRVTEKNADKSVAQAREALAASRAELLAWLDGLSDEAVLDQEGRHASLEIMSVANILRLMALHEKGHALDIARTLDIAV